MALNVNRALFAAFAGLALTHGAQAQYVNNTTDIPTSGAANNSTTENVDFGDVDLDGDWDAAFADGGDNGNEQNRLWINQGGAQGGTIGTFIERTNTQLPSVSDDSRDIEFVDFDNDGDLDIYASNTSQLTPQTNRWWTNSGGLQAGTAGNYIDETAARWVGLAGPGSSIANSELIGGGFIDWSCDCDFGDLDNDGDMDLVHSSYGGTFGGQVPTRIFLNDGLGFFSEFNPSGFQLSGANIANGNPGLWCDGNQQEETSNSNGSFCDIAGMPLDIDVGDIDGDFDLDILHGSRETTVRMFANRLNGSTLAPANGGNLGFRDVTGAVFPANHSPGGNHYEQEMGDLDGDGDLDIHGLNWRGNPFEDVTLRNTGNGVYDQLTTLQNSQTDFNEGDFVDYDNDGDLDLFIANFSGNDKLYRNNNNGGSGFSFTDVTNSEVPFVFRTSLDADCCDVDNVGDYDVFVAADSFQVNLYFENVSTANDVHAPYIPNVEKAADRVPGPDPTVIRAHVYDNAPYYITWFNDTNLNYTEDGGPVQTVPMLSSGGQVFRGEIPGNVCGTGSRRATSTATPACRRPTPTIPTAAARPSSVRSTATRTRTRAATPRR